MINNYKLGKVLGEGATAQVMQATNMENGTECALKIYRDRNSYVSKVIRTEIKAYQKMGDAPHVVCQLEADTSAIQTDTDGN